MQWTSDTALADCPLCHDPELQSVDRICNRCVGRVRSNFFHLVGDSGLLQEMDLHGGYVKSSNAQPGFHRRRQSWGSLAGLESARRRGLLSADLRFWAAQAALSDTSIQATQGSLVALGRYVFEFVDRSPNWAQIPALAISLEYWVALAMLILDPASRGRYLGPCLAENGRYLCQEPLYELTDRNLTFCLHCQAYWLIDEHRDLVRREMLDVLVTASQAKRSFEMLGRDPGLVDRVTARLVPDDRHPVTREAMFVLRRLTEASAHLSLLGAATRSTSPIR